MKLRQQPKTPISEQSSVKARLPRCLLQPADIGSAIAWRLENMPAGDVEALVLVLRPLAADFREDNPKVAAILRDLHYPNDRRGAWSLACAVLADDGGRRKDWSMFWAAGFEVMKALQQGQRGSHGNRRAISEAPADELDAELAEYLADQPAIGADALFDVATGFSAVVEIDYNKDELVCQLDSDDEKLTNVGRAEFKKREERIRQRLRRGKVSC
ncbi:MAG: hypothetical protein WC073_05200 [Sterolibacterium sp.]